MLHRRERSRAGDGVRRSRCNKGEQPEQHPGSGTGSRQDDKRDRKGERGERDAQASSGAQFHMRTGRRNLRNLYCGYGFSEKTRRGGPNDQTHQHKAGSSREKGIQDKSGSEKIQEVQGNRARGDRQLHAQAHSPLRNRAEGRLYGN